MENIKFSPWVLPWAEKKAATTTKFARLEEDERLQEILMCYLQNKNKLHILEKEQGLHSAKSYLGRVVDNHLKNLNADWSSQMTGLNGVSRDSESEEVKALKKQAQTGGISLQQEMGEDGDPLSEIVPDEGSMPPEMLIDYQKMVEAAGILGPILSGAVDHPRDWCEKFPGAAQLLVDSPALREMAVRRIVVDFAKFTNLDPDFITQQVMAFLEKWRGARGEYGDGDEIADQVEAAFTPCPDMAMYFPEGSVLRAIALCLPIGEIPGYCPGYGEATLRQAKKEARSVAEKLSLSSSDAEEFIERAVNYARSYLKANGGLVKFVAVQERLQQSLFDDL